MSEFSLRMREDGRRRVEEEEAADRCTHGSSEAKSRLGEPLEERLEVFFSFLRNSRSLAVQIESVIWSSRVGVE